MSRKWTLIGILWIPTVFGSHAGAQGPVLPPGYILVDDMILPADVFSGDSGFTANPWPFGVVPYVFDANVSAANRVLARKAMDEIDAVCGAIFVPRTNHPDWIIFNATTFNSSLVGMQGGGQTINITNWGTKYVIVHEIMHALGFIHEQSRPDRDSFVTINFGNVSNNGCPGSNCGGNGSSSCMCNFNIINGATMVGGYDFLSIMHYGRNFFSSNGLDTITCQPAFSAFQNQIGNRTFMSLGDAQGLQQRYGSTLTSPDIASISPASVTTALGSFTLHVYGSDFFGGSPNSNGVQGTKVLWNGTQLATAYVDSGHLTAQVPASLIPLPQTVQISVTNPLPGWGPSLATVPLTVTCQSGALALANGVPATVTNGCQQFSVNPVYNAFNVVAVTSPGSDWDIQMGTATANAPWNACDFVAGSGWFGAGTIQPTSGNVTLYSASTPATLQHVVSTEITDVQPTIASMPAGSIVRAFHFTPAAVSGRTIHVAGPNYLRWKLLWAGNPYFGFSWRSSTTDVLASGVVGGGPVSGIGVVAGAYCLVVTSDGIPLPAAESLTISLCFDFTPAQLASSNNILTIANANSACVPFTIAPLTGRWNVVGVSSPTDWDIQIGAAVSQLGGSNCDYVLANGHLGGISPVTGVCSPYVYPGSPGSLQFAFTAALPYNWYSYTSMILAFEIEVLTPGSYDLTVAGAPGYSWDFHHAGNGAGWRRAAGRYSGPHPADGPAVTVPNLYPGWHCVVVYHNGGPTGPVSPSLTVGYSAVQAPVLSSIAPASATAGGPGFTLAAAGSGFSASSVVRWDGSDLPTTFVSATQLTATVGASRIASPGTANVTVFTAGSGSSAGIAFSVVPASPVLTSISPMSVFPGHWTFTLSAFGNGFNAASRILWNGGPLPTAYVGPTELSATVDTSLVAALGSALVSVDNPGGGTSAELLFTIANGVVAVPPNVAPGLEPVRTWSATALGIPTPLGGLAFTANGDALVVGGFANYSAGSLYTMPVNRDPLMQRVTGLGAPALLAPAPHVDGGVAERGGTWFYTQHPLNAVGQFNGSVSTSSPLPAAVYSTGGLAFVPTGLPNAGTLLVSSFSSGGIYAIATAPAGNGFLSIGAATLFAALPMGLEGLAFISAGPFAGDLLVADFNNHRVSVLDIDPVTGLPAGGPSNPSITTIIPYWYGAEGVAVDPITGDLWLTQYGDRILHVAGLDSMATLVASAPSISANAGASVGFRLRAGTALHDRTYLLAGTFSGTSPGTPIGGLVVPLNMDSLTWFILNNLNGPVFSNFSSMLDQNGAAGATLNIPPGLGLQGPVPSDWAYLLLNPADFASDPCHLVLTP